jgi:hypothetical protein
MPTTDGIALHEHNPNDKFGGGGCLVSGGHANSDCEGRWINFWRTTTEFHQSPFAVICEKHLAEVLETYPGLEAQTEGDPLPLRKLIPATTDIPQFAGVAGVRVPDSDPEV